VPPGDGKVPSDEQTEEYEEFDLEELSGGDLEDLDPGRAIFAGSDPGAVEGMPGGERASGPAAEGDSVEEGIGPAPSEEESWLTAPSHGGMFTPAAEACADEQPPWALEMIEDLQRLRAENRELREALRCLAALVDSQIDVLREGRGRLERHLGEVGGEGEP
jgi:hypothetical protein